LAIHDALAVELTLANAHVRRLCGSQAILAQQALLREFAARTGQHAAMHGLQFQLEHEFARRKTPNLFCVVAGEHVSTPLSLDSLLGCVLLFEYRIALWNTGLLATGDSTGVGTVIASPELRARVAALVSCAALRDGCLVLTCFRNDAEPSGDGTIAFPAGQHGLWTANVREVRDRLPLQSTYALTLDMLGKRTRTHMRSDRRRLEAQTGCVFVPDAASQIAESDLVRLNTSSLKPLDQRAFDLQFHAAAQYPGGFLCGLRSAEGRWLCLAGGWRQGGTSLIEWQMNSAGFPRLSLSTAFRAYLIEHEVALGTQELCLHGGTLHSISHAFQQDHVVDLILRREGILFSLLVQLVPYFVQRDPALANRGNFLIDALRSHQIQWTPISGELVAAVIPKRT
jgi:hypothetical protein